MAVTSEEVAEIQQVLYMLSNNVPLLIEAPEESIEDDKGPAHASILPSIYTYPACTRIKVL
jgi:hypothetical protein